MNSTLIILIITAILILFTVILLKDGPPQRKRTDDRDSKKADEINRTPELLDRSQQAAELQVGQDREVVEPARFEPDAKANQKWV